MTFLQLKTHISTFDKLVQRDHHEYCLPFLPALSTLCKSFRKPADSKIIMSSSRSRPPIHPTNTPVYRRTPSLSIARRPSEAEVLCFETGPERHPYLSYFGGFRSWKLQEAFPGIVIDPRQFNCLAWAVGHTDRWIEPAFEEDINDTCTFQGPSV